MRIAITGSTGMIGTALVVELAGAGHSVTRLTRPATRSSRAPDPASRALLWDPGTGTIDAAGLEGHDALIHLAGERIAALWTPGKKARIRESRTRGTLLLAQTLARLEQPPRALLSASAIGYYGDRDPTERLDEMSPPGTGFLAEVVQEWEGATESAATAGIRVVHMRFGPVLTPRGGLLGALLPIFRLGLGGRLGSGEQVMSWIALEDVIGAVRHVLAAEVLSGPVNFVAPEPVSNAEFTHTLGRVLRRPTRFVVPAIALRALPGGMGREMLLDGACVVPGCLRRSGYVFSAPELEGALRRMLRRPS